MSARLDDRLTGTESEVLDGHLADCTRCRGEWDALMSVDEFLGSARLIPAPPNLRMRVLARLERRQRARQVLFGGVTLAVGAAALVLLVLAPVLLGVTSAGTIVPVLGGGRGESIVQMVSLLGTAARTGAVLLRAFALPVTTIALCAVLGAVAVNGAWIGVLYRLRVPR